MRLKLGQLLSRRDFMNTAISTTALMAAKNGKQLVDIMQ